MNKIYSLNETAGNAGCSEGAEQGTCYQCPGDSYTISRAVHLARLAQFYPACRNCRHREDTSLFSPQLVEQLTEVQQRVCEPGLFLADSVSAETTETLSPKVARRIARAFGFWLAEQEEASFAAGRSAVGKQPTALLSSDGRPIAPEVTSAVAEGLRQSGTAVVDLGFTTPAALLLGLHRHTAQGALYIGNPLEKVNSLGLRFYNATGAPVTRRTGLADIQQRFEMAEQPIVQKYGIARRDQTEAEYLASLEHYFHALRPLRLLLSTTNRPVVKQLARLAGNSACTITSAPGDGLCADSDEEFHLFASLESDAQLCRVADQHGNKLSSGQLFCLIVDYLRTIHPIDSVAVGGVMEESCLAILDRWNLRTVTSQQTQAGIFQTMQANSVIVGCDAGERIWLAKELLGAESPGKKGPAPNVTPVADGLHVLAILLTLLSQTDRPLSQVLADSLDGKQ